MNKSVYIRRKQSEQNFKSNASPRAFNKQKRRAFSTKKKKKRSNTRSKKNSNILKKNAPKNSPLCSTEESTQTSLKNIEPILSDELTKALDEFLRKKEREEQIKFTKKFVKIKAKDSATKSNVQYKRSNRCSVDGTVWVFIFFDFFE